MHSRGALWPCSLAPASRCLYWQARVQSTLNTAVHSADWVEPVIMDTSGPLNPTLMGPQKSSILRHLATLRLLLKDNTSSPPARSTTGLLTHTEPGAGQLA